jgi:hypothetical protein
MKDSIIAVFPRYCTVTVTVVVCESAPDWAVTLTVAVRRFVGVLLLYPPQPPIASANVNIKTAVAATGENRADGSFRTRHMANPNNAIAKRRPSGPNCPGIGVPSCAAPGETVTVIAVFAGPLAGVTVAGLKLQVTPVIGPQENATVPANPPRGVTVSANCVDWPAITLPLDGAAFTEKSTLSMSTDTPGEVLAANLSSPA